VLVGVAAGLLVLLLVSVVTVASVLRGVSSGEGSAGTPEAGEAPPEEEDPGAVGGGADGSGEHEGGEDGDEGGDGEDEGDDDEGGGDPPAYDDYETFRSQWFTLDYPSGWDVDDSEIDNTLAVFVAPGNDHQVWVTGWTEEEFTGTSAEYLQETNGGTNASGDITTDYSEVESEEFEDDYGDGWDVAMVESDFSNESWTTPERRFWTYAISLEHQGDRVFYMVSVNVPREDGDYYEDLPEEVVESFTPHI